MAIPKTVPCTFRFPGPLWLKVRERAEMDGRSINATMVKLVGDSLNWKPSDYVSTEAYTSTNDGTGL